MSVTNLQAIVRTLKSSVSTGYTKIKTATQKIFNKWTIRQERQQRVVQLIELIIYSFFFLFMHKRMQSRVCECVCAVYTFFIKCAEEIN